MWFWLITIGMVSTIGFCVVLEIFRTWALSTAQGPLDRWTALRTLPPWCWSKGQRLRVVKEYLIDLAKADRLQRTPEVLDEPLRYAPEAMSDIEVATAEHRRWCAP